VKYSKIPVAQSIVALCVAKNIKHVVISPGSRNAPLTIGFTHHPEITPYSIVDERCAAFMALGMAQQLQEPVAIVCTSGSALLNYYPAIAEAFYSDIPLVVISADRPIERIDIGDGQTIRQKNVFENHILYSANLHSEVVLESEATDKKLQQKQFESQRHNEREINLALNKALEDKGPVHINVPFYEPLYDIVDDLKVKPLQIFPDIKERTYTEKELTPYAELWNKAKRKMVIVGVAQPNAVEQQFLEVLAKDDSVLVFTETTSNLQHPEFFTRIDTLIGPIERSGDAEEQFRALQPDILLTFGGMIVSKKIKSFLRNYQPQQHWHVDPKESL
jgi:2-succinyl-5-enolpyruvyl-6-hydroxy-3-cyclohexene-1-carboxylate synthase